MKTFNELSAEGSERNYEREYANYHSRPDQIARRSARNSARRIMSKKVEKEDFSDAVDRIIGGLEKKNKIIC